MDMWFQQSVREEPFNTVQAIIVNSNAVVRFNDTRGHGQVGGSGISQAAATCASCVHLEDPNPADTVTD